jgi:hypothetical protein
MVSVQLQEQPSDWLCGRLKSEVHVLFNVNLTYVRGIGIKCFLHDLVVMPRDGHWY